MFFSVTRLLHTGPEKTIFGWSGQVGVACKARSRAQRECSGVRGPTGNIMSDWFPEVASGTI